jgi:hypothetical protein
MWTLKIPSHEVEKTMIVRKAGKISGRGMEKMINEY